MCVRVCVVCAMKELLKVVVFGLKCFFVGKTYGCSMSVFFLYTFEPGVQLSSMKW